MFRVPFKKPHFFEGRLSAGLKFVAEGVCVDVSGNEYYEDFSHQRFTEETFVAAIFAWRNEWLAGFVPRREIVKNLIATLWK